VSGGEGKAITDIYLLFFDNELTILSHSTLIHLSNAYINHLVRVS